MKKFCILFLSLFIITLTAIGGAMQTAPNRQPEYLRIHIRANSNAAEDQAVKYLVRDAVVDAITPWIVNCHSKEQAISVMQSRLKDIEAVSQSVLRSHGYDYIARAAVRAEEFPTRVYEEYTLPSGVYDALILELGTGAGDNWWCCIYPPLCFTGVGGKNIVYRSKLAEIIEAFFSQE